MQKKKDPVLANHIKKTSEKNKKAENTDDEDSEDDINEEEGEKEDDEEGDCVEEEIVGQEGDAAGINGKRKAKNETKNIPKNYAKAFLRYIIDKTRVNDMKRILASFDSCGLQYEDIKKEAKIFKKNMNAIKDVRKIWQDESNSRTKAITKFMRIASH